MKKIFIIPTFIIPTFLTILGLSVSGCSQVENNETDNQSNNNSISMQSDDETVIVIEGTPDKTSEITNNLILSDYATIIDIRSPEEFAEGHLKDAVNEDFYNENFLTEMNKNYKKDAHIVIYCRSGNRTAQAIELLRNDGFLNIIDLGSMEDAANIMNIEIVK